MRIIGIKNHTCEELEPNPQTCENLVPNYHLYMKNKYLMVKIKSKSVKNWNRMQNAADLGVFYQCEEDTCMFLKFDFVRIFHKV